MPLSIVGMNQPLLRVCGLQVDFGAHAVVRDVNFELAAGETLGLVGESGSGKSTVARAILRLVRASGGSVEWRGQNLLTLSAPALRSLRRELQIVFQDPLGSLNPRMAVGDSIAEPLKIFEPGMSAAGRGLRVGEMLERVGLGAAMAARYPHEFSGGQCQRIGIARAMIGRPALLVCDEPVSSLDVSIQGQIVNLLLDLQRDVGTAMLFISHNLAVVRHVSHRVLVIYLGRIVEIAANDSLFASPVHPYTRGLMAAVARADFGPSALPSASLSGFQSAAGLLASGCAFRDRCPYALPVCETTLPPLEEVAEGHLVACHRSHEALIPLSFLP
jgi:oligopeptide transport system ATP-binding protein